MSSQVIRAVATALLTNVLIPAQAAAQQKIQPICSPTLSAPIVVESSHARNDASTKAVPTLADGFDWPDAPRRTDSLAKRPESAIETSPPNLWGVQFPRI